MRLFEKGLRFGSNINTKFHELVFNTSLVGYNESITDPSYRNQILILTNPLVGNYGTPSYEKDQFNLHKNFESGKIQVSGLIVGNYSTHFSHWNAKWSLSDFCKSEDVPILSGIDTRELTHLLRNNPLSGKIEDNKLYLSNNFESKVKLVSTKQILNYNPKGKIKIAVLDFGIKENIIRCLIKRGCSVTVYPYNFDLTNEEFDGVLLSNGPGDPKCNVVAVNNVKKLIEIKKPIFGICMGLQILGLSISMETYKMKYGNRGHNQPVIDLMTNKTYITSQNHGYALNEKSLPDLWRISYKNMNDNTVEGISHESLPYFAVQFHPENHGGPKDTEFLFDKFVDQCKL
jgi:carbamoyl-phosphate synthase small subunit